MSEKITFTIPGDPPRVTAQQKGQNRTTGEYYKPQRLRDAEVPGIQITVGELPKMAEGNDGKENP